MLSEEDKIRLIHEYRAPARPHVWWAAPEGAHGAGLGWNNRYSPSHPEARSESDAIGSPARGLFALALQQVVDSIIAGLLPDEAFELPQEQRREAQILLEGIDLGGAQW